MITERGIKMRALVVDGSAVVRDVLMRFLVRGLSVDVVAAEGSEAAAIGAFDRLRPDLVVLDIAIPQPEDGLGFIRHIRAMSSGARVLVLTTLQDYREKCTLAGASTVLGKPVDFDRLAAVIGGWRHGEGGSTGARQA